MSSSSEPSYRLRLLGDALERAAKERAELLALPAGSPERASREAAFQRSLDELRTLTPKPQKLLPRSPLDAARRAADVLRVEVPPSHRQRIGTAITAAKRLTMRALRPLTSELLTAQRDFNFALLRVLDALHAAASTDGASPRPAPEQVRAELQARLHSPEAEGGVAGRALRPLFDRQAHWNLRAAELAERAARGAPADVKEANALVASLAALGNPLEGQGGLLARAAGPLTTELFRNQRTFNTEVMLSLAELLNGRPPVVPPSDSDYRAWLAEREPSRIRAVAVALLSLEERPTLSILLPAWETPPRVLEQCLASVVAQSYEQWELCVVDDGSRTRSVREVVEPLARRDPRIKWRRLERNAGIAAATNAALELATGDFVLFLDHDDELAPHALGELALRIARSPELDWLYSDEDRLSADGEERYGPRFKPEPSLELLRTHNYVRHLLAARRSLVQELGGLREGFEGAQDYDLVLRLAERSARAARVPGVLYHWRAAPFSFTADPERARVASAAGARALREHLERQRERAEVLELGGGEYRVRYALQGRPLVSIIVPFKDKPELLDLLTRTLLPRTRYREFELLLVSNNSADPRTSELLGRLDDPRIRKLEWNHPFNYPALNNWAARQARGELLLFLNNDMEVEDPDWLDELVSQLQRPGVGLVGPKLRFPDGSLQHAGVVVGIGGYAAHPFWRFPDARHLTPFGHADLNRDYLSVTSACALVRRALFEELGGFDERFQVCGSDIDLGIRIREKGQRVVYTAGTWLYHHESASRRTVQLPEGDLWHSVVRYRRFLEEGDPFYNPNLTLTSTDCTLRESELSGLELAAQELLFKETGR